MGANTTGECLLPIGPFAQDLAHVQLVWPLMLAVDIPHFVLLSAADTGGRVQYGVAPLPGYEHDVTCDLKALPGIGDVRVTIPQCIIWALRPKTRSIHCYFFLLPNFGRLPFL